MNTDSGLVAAALGAALAVGCGNGEAVETLDVMASDAGRSERGLDGGSERGGSDGGSGACEDCDDSRDADVDGGGEVECLAPEDCDDGDPCNGEESCEGHTCVPGHSLECDDGDPCTTDACVPGTGCVHELIDEDGDGFAPAELGTCANPLRSGDCDDTLDAVHPGADGWQERPFCIGQGERATGTFPRFQCEDGAIPSFDYDCSGDVQRRYDHPVSGGCRAGIKSCSGGGWLDGVPRCGEPAILEQCDPLCGTRRRCECTASRQARVQACR